MPKIKPIREGNIKKGGMNKIPIHPKPDIKPAGQKGEKHAIS